MQAFKGNARALRVSHCHSLASQHDALFATSRVRPVATENEKPLWLLLSLPSMLSLLLRVVGCS